MGTGTKAKSILHITASRNKQRSHFNPLPKGQILTHSKGLNLTHNIRIRFYLRIGFIITKI